MKKAISILLALTLILIPLAACDNGNPSTSSPSSSSPSGSGNAGDGQSGEKTLKAAMILPGPISDPGFNGPAYDGLVRIEKELGYETSFTENVAPADYESVFRTYAQQGYNIVFAHGAQFLETAMTVAEEFPDTWFAVSSAFGTNEKNVSGWNLNTYDVGFLAGVLMAQMSNTKKIGMVSGAELPPIVMMYDAMRAGAAYVDPSVEVRNVFTSETADSGQCREAANALIDAGCDLLSSTAGVGAPGAIAACADAGYYFVGTSADWSPIDPSTVLTSIFTDWGGAAFLTAELYKKGELRPMPYINGIAEDAVYFVGFGELESAVPAEVKTRLDDIIAKVVSGEINIAELVGALSN